MPAVVIRGVGPSLKGKVGQTSTLTFGAENIADQATVVINGFGGDGTLYVWSGQVKDPPDIKKPGKVKIKMECISGRTTTSRAAASASDIIDVTITVTNTGESPTSSSEVVEVI